MPYVLGAVAGAVLLIAIVALLFGARDARRVAAVVAIVGLAALTITVLVNRPAPSDGDGAATPSAPASSTPVSPSPAGPTPAASVAPSATPAPTHLRWEVRLDAGTYRLLTIDSNGTATGSRRATFSNRSTTTVDRVEASNGLVHWRTVLGGYAGWSYVAGQSGPFSVVEVVQQPDGTVVEREVDPSS